MKKIRLKACPAGHKEGAMISWLDTGVYLVYCREEYCSWEYRRVDEDRAVAGWNTRHRAR